MSELRWILLCVAMLATTLAGVAQAQTSRVSKDVSTPASDAGIPELLTGVSSLIRLQDVATLQFDSILDPSNGADPSQLTPAAQSIIHNHMLAQQQVELAIRFLQANREEIIAGRNAIFNKIYGTVTKKTKVAVLAPVALPGQFNLVSPTLLQNVPQQGGNQQQASIGSVETQLRVGNSLFLIDPTTNPNLNINTQGTNQTTFQRRVFPSLTTTGFVVKVAGLIRNSQNNQNNQGGGQNNNQPS